MFLILFLFASVNIYADEKVDKEWILDRFNFYFEDDIYNKTDDGYSAGERLSLLYFIPEEDYRIYDLFSMDFGNSYSYITFALTNQIFTPTDTQRTDLIVDDRPYAGWTYFEAGIHKSSKKHLRSLVLKVGVLGSLSFSQDIQNGVHSIIGSHEVKGWNNQLDNELGINLKYTHKWLFQTKKIGGFEISGVPFLSAEAGNIAINATAGVSARFGYNIPKDFGVSSIDIGADPGIPIYGQYQNMKSESWSFSINLLGAGSAVARDIFLDGNTFSDSHSVEKENFVYYYGFGFTLRYKNFVLDFIEINNSKKFKLEKKGHGVGTLVFSWLY
ncbi:MAG: lipid A deacylase LpxR family protein [Epsilonproteobacteria bacterium]|nr:lipid A deacylase LpxR family protein [Campylobacterota bacterium]